MLSPSLLVWCALVTSDPAAVEVGPDQEEPPPAAEPNRHDDRRATRAPEEPQAAADLPWFDALAATGIAVAVTSGGGVVIFGVSWGLRLLLQSNPIYTPVSMLASAAVVLPVAAAVGLAVAPFADWIGGLVVGLTTAVVGLAIVLAVGGSLMLSDLGALQFPWDLVVNGVGWGVGLIGAPLCIGGAALAMALLFSPGLTTAALDDE